MYDEDTASFEDIPPDALLIDPHCDCKMCFSCDVAADEENKKIVRLSKKKNELRVFGESYHQYDFVYIPPSGGQLVYEIGQVLAFKEGKDGHHQVKVQYLGRYDDYITKQRKVHRAGFHDTSRPDLVLDEVSIFTPAPNLHLLT